MQHLRTALAVLALGLSAGAASAQVITNGGFDANSGYITTNVSGWTVQFGNVDLVYAGAPGSSVLLESLMTGATGNALDLNGLVPAMISQVLQTTAGQTYNISFSYAANPGVDPGDNPLSTFTMMLSPVSGGSGVLSSNLTGSGSSWATYSGSFTAAGLTTLSFLSTDYSGSLPYGAMLDNVSVTAVPEPAEYAMLIAGLGVIGAVARRRKAA